MDVVNGQPVLDPELRPANWSRRYKANLERLHSGDRRQHVGLDEWHVMVLMPGPVKRRSGQVDSDGMPAPGSEVGDLCSAPEVDRGSGLAEPPVRLGLAQLRRGNTKVPPAVDAIEVGVSHSPDDPPIPRHGSNGRARARTALAHSVR